MLPLTTKFHFCLCNFLVLFVHATDTKLNPKVKHPFCVSRKAEIEIEIGIEFVISFSEIIQLACQQAVLTT